jgi:bacillithiol system protein YtxJ
MLQPLTTQAEAEALIASATPAWLLKHSDTCGISQVALEEVEAYLAGHHDARAGIIVVQTQRPLSTWLAARLQRVHQSPQLFLLKEGAVRWSASHYSITAAAMERAAADEQPSRSGR